MFRNFNIISFIHKNYIYLLLTFYSTQVQIALLALFEAQYIRLHSANTNIEIILLTTGTANVF